MACRYPYGKIELHLHLDGSVRPQTVSELLAKDEGRISALDAGPFAAGKMDLEKEGRFLTAEECRRKMSCGAECKNLETYLALFDLPLHVLQTPEALRRATYELLEDLAEDGVIYAELRFSPQSHTRKGMTQKEALFAVLEGINDAKQRKLPIEANIILCMMRMPPFVDNRKENKETLALAIQYQKYGIALDLAGGENLVPMADYKEFFMGAARQGVPFTIHAGEAGGAEHVIKAVNWGAKRIGHGCRAIESEQAIELLRQRQIPLEICITSNVQTKAQISLKGHSVQELIKKGICITISTDNRTVSDTTLEKEYRLLREELGFTIEMLRQTNRWALQNAFCTKEQKRKLERFL